MSVKRVLEEEKEEDITFLVQVQEFKIKGGGGVLAQMCSPECGSGFTFLPPHLCEAFTRQYFTFILSVDRLSTWSIIGFVKLLF